MIPVSLTNAIRNPKGHLPPLVKLLFDNDAYASWRRHPKVIKLYFSQFDLEPPASANPTQLKTLVNVPTIALFAIQHTFIDNSKTVEMFEYKQACESHWPTMWRWINFIYRACTTSSETSYDRLTLLIEGILSLVIQPPLNAAVAATKGLLGLCFAIYLRLPNDPPSTSSIADRLEIASDTLVNLLQIGKVDLKEIHSEIGSEEHQAAHALFRPAYMCMLGGPTFANTLGPVVNVHLQICDSVSSDFYGQFPAKTIMRYICDCLSFVLTYSNRNAPLKNPSGILGILVKFLDYYHWSASDGHAWIVYGLRNNLLSLLLQAANHVQDQDDSTTIPAVGNILRTLNTVSIHRPVLRHLRDVPRNVDFSQIKDATLRSLGVALKKAIKWSQEAHIEFLEIGKYLKCSNVNKPFTVAFCIFLMEREMERQKDFIKEGLRKLELQSEIKRTGRKPVFLLLDISNRESTPPPAFELVTSPTANQLVDGLRLVPGPIVVPCLRFTYGWGVINHVTPATINTAGNIFGWIV
ncbi:hypothetical protein H0H93_005673 [Arthromyces matolae]|nr:hypothetical protein H0H93_005673 [Arthromyces matolae]